MTKSLVTRQRNTGRWARNTIVARIRPERLNASSGCTARNSAPTGRSDPAARNLRRTYQQVLHRSLNPPSTAKYLEPAGLMRRATAMTAAESNLSNANPVSTHSRHVHGQAGGSIAVEPLLLTVRTRVIFPSSLNRTTPAPSVRESSANTL